MWFSWHGSAGCSFKVGNKEVLVDPSFSQKGDYGPWYIPNANAPDFNYYIKNYNPDYLIITHGHFDHFDIETLRIIEKVKMPRYIGSPEITEALIEYFRVPAERLISIKPGTEIKLNGDFTIKAFLGDHFLTGKEGTEAANKLKSKPDRYGVMPCGGPAMGYIIRNNQLGIYLSGDTLLPGIPREQVDMAFINVGGPLIHPVTREKFQAILGIEDAQVAMTQLNPRFLVPMHYDFPYMEPIDISLLKNRVADISSTTEIIVPSFNSWGEVEI